jgi:phytoene synthase
VELTDPERRLALAYVPASRRGAVATLWSLDEQFARVVLSAREAAIGQLKLAWWRDALEALDTRPPPGEPLLQALAATVLRAGVSGSDMAAMAEGWDALLPPDAVDGAALAVHGAERGERLFALTGRLLGGDVPAGAGAVWATADALKILPAHSGGRGTAGEASGGGISPPSASRIPLRHASRGPPPHATRRGDEVWAVPVRPLGMLHVLALRDPAERQGSPARLLRMLRHRLTGR